MSVLQDRITELVTQHGSLRAAARVLETDAGYLSRLQSGEKDDPGETLLRRMGLRRVVTYERRKVEQRSNDDSQLSVNARRAGAEMARPDGQNTASPVPPLSDLNDSALPREPL